MLPVWNDYVTAPVHVMTEFAVSISAPKAVELKRNRAVKKNLGMLTCKVSLMIGARPCRSDVNTPGCIPMPICSNRRCSYRL